jgi:hypothetical protein
VEGGVEEICFKELYVSTSVESEYYDRASNDWSADNQVPLRVVLELAQDAGWSLVEQLPSVGVDERNLSQLEPHG